LTARHFALGGIIIRIPLVFIATFGVLVSCVGTGWKDTGLEPFCANLDDANLYRIEGATDGSANGAVSGQLMSADTQDLYDFDYVGYVAYAMKNTKTGGTQTTGLTDNLGEFIATVGEGSWAFTAGALIQGKSCTATMAFEVEGGRQTTICPSILCEE
jgi:hypothetical protein